jgi:hypothetical protein
MASALPGGPDNHSLPVVKHFIEQQPSNVEALIGI